MAADRAFVPRVRVQIPASAVAEWCTQLRQVTFRRRVRVLQPASSANTPVGGYAIVSVGVRDGSVWGASHGNPAHPRLDWENEKMREPEIRNVKIGSTVLGPKASDHKCFSAWLHCEWDGGGQGFGGYVFDEYDANKKRRVGVAWGMEFLCRVLDVLEVDSWEKLPGTPCRIVSDHCKIHKIGHYLKDKWFDPNDLNDLKHMIED